jgi:HEAT repeat protein
MTKRPALWLSIATILVVAALCAFPTNRYLRFGLLKSEPFENGRPIGYWMDELKTGDAARREEAAATLGSMVTQAKVAVPALVQVIRDDDPKVRRAAIAALGRLGPDAQESVPALLQVYEDRNEEREIRWAVLAAFGQMGTGAEDAVPVMIKMMAKDINFAGVAQIQSTVKHMGPAAVPELVQFLQDENAKVRAHAAVALNWIGPGAKNAVPELIRSLEDNANSVRQSAAFALMRIGPEAKVAVPALIQALQDADPEVRRVSAMALKEVDPNALATEGMK